MEKKISVFRRVVYIYFGITGILMLIRTGIWHKDFISTFFRATVVVCTLNWGVLGITGKELVEWIEIAFKNL